MAIPLQICGIGLLLLVVNTAAADFLQQNRFPSALEIADTQRAVTVAIVDDGVANWHQDIEDFLWRNPHEVEGNRIDDDGNGMIDDVFGWDFGDGNSTPWPQADERSVLYHGTHLAGILTAAFRHAYGERAPELLRILPIKSLPDNAARPVLVRPFKAIEYAITQGADVILCAWGVPEISPDERAVLELAARNGILVVASTGNVHEDIEQYPAAHPDVLAVAGHDRLGRKLPNSRFGSFVDLIAAGERIVAADADSESSRIARSGTSQSAAVVAAAAAIYKVERPSASPLEIRAALLNNATFSDANRAYHGRLGAGKLNLEMAISNGHRFQPAQWHAPRGVLHFSAGAAREIIFMDHPGVAGIRLQGDSAQSIHNNRLIHVDFLRGSEQLSQEITAEELSGSVFVSGKQIRMRWAPSGNLSEGEWLLPFAMQPIELANQFCSGEPLRFNSPGIIEDGSGEQSYAPDSDCKWFIKAPPGKVIRFTFLEFETEHLVDKVYFFNGTGTHAPIMAILTGNEPPDELVTWRNEVLVWFVSNGANEKSGFRMAFEFIEPAGI